MERDGGQRGTIQFGLKRIFACTLIIAAISFLYVSLGWPLAMLAIAAVDIFASLVYWARGRFGMGLLTFLSATFIVLTLLFTDWGFSSVNPQVHVAWTFLMWACVFQLSAILGIFVQIPDAREFDAQGASLPGGD